MPYLKLVKPTTPEEEKPIEKAPIKTPMEVVPNQDVLIESAKGKNIL